MYDPFYYMQVSYSAPSFRIISKAIYSSPWSRGSLGSLMQMIIQPCCIICTKSYLLVLFYSETITIVHKGLEYKENRFYRKVQIVQRRLNLSIAKEKFAN